MDHEDHSHKLQPLRRSLRNVTNNQASEQACSRRPKKRRKRVKVVSNKTNQVVEENHQEEHHSSSNSNNNNNDARNSIRSPTKNARALQTLQETSTNARGVSAGIQPQCIIIHRNWTETENLSPVCTTNQEATIIPLGSINKLVLPTTIQDSAAARVQSIIDAGSFSTRKKRCWHEATTLLLWLDARAQLYTDKEMTQGPIPTTNAAIEREWKPQTRQRKGKPGQNAKAHKPKANATVVPTAGFLKCSPICFARLKQGQEVIVFVGNIQQPLQGTVVSNEAYCIFDKNISPSTYLACIKRCSRITILLAHTTSNITLALNDDFIESPSIVA